jgi:hypothetical protein
MMCCQRHAPIALSPGKNLVPIIWEAQWAAGTVWMKAENLVPTGFHPRTIQPVESYYTDRVLPTGILTEPPQIYKVGSTHYF